MSDTQEKNGAGGMLGVPVHRFCGCPAPTVYEDQDGDVTCFRCGHLVKVA